MLRWRAAAVTRAQGAEAVAFAAAAKALDESFAATADAAVAAHLGLAAVAPAVGLLKTYDEPFVAFEGDFTAEALAAFVKRNSKQLVVPFSAASAPAIFKSAFQLLALIPPGAAAGGELAAALRATALAVRGEDIQVVTVDTSAEDAKQVSTFFGVAEGQETPLVFGFVSASSSKFRMPPPYAADALAAFARAVADGSAPPFRLSAAAPESNDGPVTVITGDTFDGLVLDTDKDVLLEIYAPWCGHCKTLEPIYEKLGRRFAAVDSVIIAKMDGTANEHPAAKASGFPTLIFFPAGEGAQPVPYAGERTLKEMTKFIKKHAVLPYELPKKADAKEGAAGEAAAAGGAHDEL
jgi:protein disulfide-isomerase A1